MSCHVDMTGQGILVPVGAHCGPGRYAEASRRQASDRRFEPLPWPTPITIVVSRTNVMLDVPWQTWVEEGSRGERARSEEGAYFGT